MVVKHFERGNIISGAMYFIGLDLTAIHLEQIIIIIVREAVQPAKPKRFTICSLKKMFADPRPRILIKRD